MAAISTESAWFKGLRERVADLADLLGPEMASRMIRDEVRATASITDKTFETHTDEQLGKELRELFDDGIFHIEIIKAEEIKLVGIPIAEEV